MVMHCSTDEAFAPRCPRRRMVLVATYRIDVGDRRMDANAAEQGILGLSLMTPSPRALRREIGSTAAFRTLANVIL
jgi:hypothetical protein